jgi:predicted ATP-grasp superfamily ATP-dependent carboligase
MGVSIVYEDGPMTMSKKYTEFEDSWTAITIPEGANIVGIYGRYYIDFHIRQFGFLVLVPN